MKWIRLGLGVTAALVAGGALTFAVLGRSGTAQADDNSTTSRLEEILAQKLGISVDALKAAQTGARNQFADELAASGKITQAQADKIKSADIGAMLGGLGHMGGKSMVRGARVEVNIAEITANLAHIDNATLKSELEQGKSFAQIAQEHGVSRDSLKNAIISAEKTQLQTAVSKGNVTQQMADTIAQKLASHVDAMIDRTPGSGHFKGMGPMMPKPSASP